jgi:16S rRNA (cytosine1402-N4)-methyltransferase
MHTPVLLNEVLAALDPQSGDFMIDGTMDGGGHAAAIMEKIGPSGIFLGVDLDPTMIERAKEKFSGMSGNYFVHGNYADLPEILAKENLGKADGLLLDLGFSSEQIEESGRGFSFSAERADEPLLMTYDDSRTPVHGLLRSLSEQDLANIIFELGGERGSRRIAKAIKEQGRRRPIRTAGDLAKTVRLALPANYERGRIDPATRTFQALRIYANGELENVKTVLGNLGAILKPGGRAAIITFHSLEDRIVKQAFQKMAKEKQGELFNKKPITASREEIRQNSRSRSAKLRAIKLLS